MVATRSTSGLTRRTSARLSHGSTATAALPKRSPLKSATTASKRRRRSTGTHLSLSRGRRSSTAPTDWTGTTLTMSVPAKIATKRSMMAHTQEPETTGRGPSSPPKNLYHKSSSRRIVHTTPRRKPVRSALAGGGMKSNDRSPTQIPSALKPRPVKSCLSAKKKPMAISNNIMAFLSTAGMAPPDGTTQSLRNVTFTGPKVAEFDFKKPVKNGLTPMKADKASKLFPVGSPTMPATNQRRLLFGDEDEENIAREQHGTCAVDDRLVSSNRRHSFLGTSVTRFGEF